MTDVPNVPFQKLFHVLVRFVDVVEMKFPIAVAVDWPAAVSIADNCVRALDALVPALVAFVDAVFAVDAVAAAAVCTSLAVFPVTDVPYVPFQNAFQVDCKFVTAVLKAVPTAVAVACPAAVSIDVNWDSADVAFVDAVFAVDDTEPAAV